MLPIIILSPLLNDNYHHLLASISIHLLYKSQEIIVPSQKAEGVHFLRETSHSSTVLNIKCFNLSLTSQSVRLRNCLPSIIRVTKACCCTGSEFQKRPWCEQLNCTRWAHPKSKKPMWKHCFQQEETEDVQNLRNTDKNQRLGAEPEKRDSG